MDPVTVYLASIGISVASSAIYDGLKKIIKKDNPSIVDFKEELISLLNIDGAEVYAEKLIEILAQKGDITITGTHIFANDSITMSSSPGRRVEFGNNSISETKKTRIVAGDGAKIILNGDTEIKQDDDGSITFSC